MPILSCFFFPFGQSPRRNCCHVSSSKKKSLILEVGVCKEGEISEVFWYPELLTILTWTSCDLSLFLDSSCSPVEYFSARSLWKKVGEKSMWNGAINVLNLILENLGDMKLKIVGYFLTTTISFINVPRRFELTREDRTIWSHWIKLFNLSLYLYLHVFQSR